MTTALSDHPDFAAALTLEERAALARYEAPAGERARKRLERWRAQEPFGRDGFFARRLAAAGLDEAGLLALLDEPREALAARLGKTPGWLRELLEAFQAAVPGAPLPFPEEEPEVRLLGLASPLIQQAERRIAEAVSGLAAAGRPLPFDPGTVGPLLLSGLSNQLLWTITRAAVLELNVARLEGRVGGETSEERFAAFVDLLRRPDEGLALLAIYPVLARQLALRIGGFADAAIELLSRLTRDWDDLRAAFGPAAEPGPLTAVTFGAGDRHRGGRTVCLLTFASGWRVVYKPRPMAIAAHFQELLGWLNERGFTPAFRRLGVLDRPGYGWMELAAAGPCASREEVSRFYQRMGGYLALLYALDASDFHYENLIAAGEQPLLIDLESIVQPRVAAPPDSGADWIANQILGESVLRIGLLPQRFWGGAGEGIDISGLGSPAGQLSPDRFPYWEERGTDAMQLRRRQLPMRGADNQPTVGGEEVDVNEHADELIDGFSRAYRLLWRHRDELLAGGGPIARMAGDEVRVLLRPTRTYALLLQESFHPFLLRDALERDRHFDHLWQGVAESTAIGQVVAAERQELLAGDIPLFSARLDSRDLLGVGGESWPGFFERSGLELVRGRLAALSETDLAKQVWFTRASLAAHRANVFGVEDDVFAPAAALGAGVDAGAAGRGRLLAAAVAVGDRLESLALHGAEDATWIGLRSQMGRDWHLRPLGSDLYGGLPGVVVFLSYLAAATGEDRYRRLARAGWRTLWREWGELRGVLTSIGGFEGWGGLLWTLAHLSRLWDDGALLDEAQAIAARLPELIAKDTALDVLTGTAGCLAGLLALHGTSPADRTLEVAVACGERLLAQARPMERGVAWASSATSSLAPQPMAGFAHGAAGIAWVLLELSAATGDGRFRAAALDAFEYERGLYVPEQRNWRDVRQLEKLLLARQVGDDTFMMAWCHGAPGAGLARLRALRHVDDPALRAEAVTALESTRDGGFDRSHCLCHGDLGNVEVFLQAAEILDDGERWRAEVDRITAFILANIAEHGWKCGLPSALEVPGLMAGLAGIGYGLLRLADPQRVPSVLLLAPPVSS